MASTLQRYLACCRHASRSGCFAKTRCACARRDNQTHGIKARRIAFDSYSYEYQLPYGVLMWMSNETGLYN
jgi:hypothetical protein